MATAPPPSESGCVSMVTAGDGDDTEDDACTIRDEEVSYVNCYELVPLRDFDLVLYVFVTKLL